MKLPVSVECVALFICHSTNYSAKCDAYIRCAHQVQEKFYYYYKQSFITYKYQCHCNILSYFRVDVR